MKPVHIVDLACQVADVHHRYQEVHGALFGAASFRLIIDAMRGNRQRKQKECAQKLNGLGAELAVLEAQIAAVDPVEGGRAVDRPLQEALLAYTQVLHKAVSGLETIFERLEQAESAYRAAGPDGPSGFTRDKLQYDHLLLEMDRLGTRLNRLFVNY